MNLTEGKIQVRKKTNVYMILTSQSVKIQRTTPLRCISVLFCKFQQFHVHSQRFTWFTIEMILLVLYFMDVFFLVSLFKLSMLMCGKRHRNRAHLAIAVFFCQYCRCLQFCFICWRFFFSSLCLCLCLPLSLVHAKRLYSIRTSIFVTVYSEFQLTHRESYNVYMGLDAM